MAAKYNYTYTIVENKYRQLVIETPGNTVCMNLSPDDENHRLMIALFFDVRKLELYVNYLGDNPNRPFVIDEIMSLDEPPIIENGTDNTTP